MQVDELSMRVQSQDWEGLTVVDGLEARGRGVVATKEFKVTEVVCDYGGELRNYRDGKLVYENSAENQMGFMFLFTFKGHKYWRDATTETEGFGRLINHSKCHANVSIAVLVSNIVLGDFYVF